MKTVIMFVNMQTETFLLVHVAHAQCSVAQLFLVYHRI